MLLFAFAGCDVHEFPEESNDKVAFLLHLDFNTEMPIYKEITYTRNACAEAKREFEQHDIRYTINAYRAKSASSENRIADATFVFTKPDATDLNYTAQLKLPEGTYNFKVWADYVDAHSTDDKYYDTHDFSEIILKNKDNHSGSNDYREAFRGYASATVTNAAYYTGCIANSIDNQATAEMKRPMGKFKFISTDVEAFLNRVAAMTQKQDESANAEANSKEHYGQMLHDINFNDYYVVIRYNAFMPCSFNLFTDKPADSWTSISFVSPMVIEGEREITLGYDYIFVNGSETTLSVSLEVYNKEGKLMSSTNQINVPIVRSKLTVVKGEFLTSKATDGVSINPCYDGEDYNIEII